ncbi:aminoglycoside 6-adenylyltransferase [Helicobacter ibis]|uniref:Aminoglycoside 6-adenylyltransferase n=1 Tax=Helicobacter ibis TaxID=2962633 RepID=A0ABT4VD50_9HELI|nr:aminoglycoside 6-adenylyltransferase [Helicobacter ibis]MDA3968633.1 aminoglycoside 6-adenylyltransferase [Helicobacter ibis]
MNQQTQINTIKAIKNFTIKHKAITIATLEGSRVNPKAKKDKYQDYDISFFVPLDSMHEFLEISSQSDIKSAKIPSKILVFTSKHFGRLIFSQLPESMEFYKPDLPPNWVSFLMLFANGVRLDLKIIPLQDLNAYYELEPLSKVLVDKDNLFTHTIPQTPFSITHLSQKCFDDVCNEFYFTLSNVQKALLREQFILANHLLDSMRKALFVMLSFKVGLKQGFNLWLGKENAYILHYLSKKEVKIIRGSYHTHSLKHIAKSLEILEELFSKSVKHICKKSDYKNPYKNLYKYRFYK